MFGLNPPKTNVTGKRKLKDPAAQHQPQRADGQHDDVEVPPSGRFGHDADHEPDQRDGDEQPVGPAEQRDERDQRAEESDDADNEGRRVEHGWRYLSRTGERQACGWRNDLSCSVKVLRVLSDHVVLITEKSSGVSRK